PITRARAKRLQETVSALFAQLWNENELQIKGKARASLLTNPCTLLQVEFNWFPTHQAPFSSNQLN
ncbi:hypothetical protein J1N35_007712, partial [Gossypium stocksii]